MPSDLRTTPRRPRKDEIMSAVKLLRTEAAKARNYAVGHRKMAEDRPQYAETFLKSAKQMDARATRYDKVAEWMCNG